MKALFLLAVLILGAGVPAMAANDSRVAEVTLFKDRAFVKRRQSVNLAKGPASIIFSGVSPVADTDSIKVRVSDKKNLSVMGVRTESKHRLKTESPELRGLQEREIALEKDQQEILRKVGLLVKGNENLSSLTDHYKDSFALNLHQNTWTRPQFQTFVGFLLSESGKLNGEWHKLYLQHDKLAKELEWVRNRISSLTSPSDKTTRVITVDVIADSAGSRDVEVQYLVTGGGWTPVYDLRIEGSDKARLEQYALAWQNSGEDWNNVKLTLSNVQSELSPVAPTIESYTLNYREAQKITTEVRSGKQDHQALGVGGSEDDDEAQSKGLARNFVISGQQTVRSNNARTKIFISGKSASYDEHLELVAEQYPHVYRKGELENPFSWDIAAGPMSVYYDGAFIQQTWQQAVARGDSFAVNTGIEHALKVSYAHNDRSEAQGFVAKKRQYVRTFFTSLTNYSAKPKEIKVLKQIPVSEIEAVKVDLDSKKKFTSDDDLEGWLAWNLKVPSKKTETIELKVSVLTPADFQFNW